MRLSLLAAVSVSPITFLPAQSAELSQARSLRCTFGVTVIADLDSVPVKMQRSTETGFVVVIDAIDREAKTARLIGNTGTADLGVIQGRGVLSFLEITGAGNPVVYTVSATYQPGTRDFIAASSKHVLSPPKPTYTVHMFGTCRVFQ